MGSRVRKACREMQGYHGGKPNLDRPRCSVSIDCRVQGKLNQQLLLRCIVSAHIAPR